MTREFSGTLLANAQAASNSVAELAPAARATARLVQIAPDFWLAFSVRVTLAVVENPAITPVPGLPAHLPGLLQWQGHVLPVLDAAKLLRIPEVQDQTHDPTDTEARTQAPRAIYVLVLAWRNPHPGVSQGSLDYGAVLTHVLPHSESISNDMQCPLPAHMPRLHECAISCFHWQEKAVPIIDTAQLFGRYHA